MLKQKRQMQILELLQRDGEVTVSGLSRSFGVAEMTIRRDIEDICAHGHATRTHGGAVVGSMPEPSAKTEETITNKVAKSAIARRALTFIRDGTTVYFDAGSTGLLLAQNVPASQHISAITNAIPIAMELIERQFVSVILIGGELKRGVLSCRGSAAEDMLARFHADLAFIGVSAIGRDGALFADSVAEAGFKRGIIDAADQCIVLADSSKLLRQNLCRFADIHDVDAIITDDRLTPEQIAVLSRSKTQVSVAKTGGQRPALQG